MRNIPEILSQKAALIYDFLTKGRNVIAFLILILVVAAIPRIYLIQHCSENDFLHIDGREYKNISENLAKGNGFSISYYRWYEPMPPGANPNEIRTDFSRMPALPVIGAVFYFFPFDWLAQAKVFSLIFSLLTVYGVFLLGKELASPVLGLLSALIFGIYPYGIYYAASWSTENLSLLMLLLFVLFLLKSLREIRMLSMSSLFLVLAILTRPTALLLFPAFLIPCAYLYFKKKRNAKELVQAVLLYMAIFVVLMLPWSIRNYRIGGSFTPLSYYSSYSFWLSSSDVIYQTYKYLDTPQYTEKTDDAWNRLHKEKLEYFKEKGIYDYISCARLWKKWGWEEIRNNPDKVLYILKERFLHYFRMCPNMVVLTPKQILLMRCYFTVLFVLALCGVYFSRKTKVIFMLALPLFGLFLSIPFLFVLRYRYPFFAPYVCIFAAYAIFFVWLNLIHRGGKKPGVSKDVDVQ